MLKKYTAASEVAINIKVNGTARHISFSPKTLGGSVYYTDNEDEQKALESHYRYGELYKGEEVVEAPVKKPVVKEVNEIKDIEASCVDDAKDYLCEHFSLSRTKLKTIKAITDAAAKHNVHFVGPDFNK